MATAKPKHKVRARGQGARPSQEGWTLDRYHSDDESELITANYCSCCCGCCSARRCSCPSLSSPNGFISIHCYRFSVPRRPRPAYRARGMFLVPRTAPAMYSCSFRVPRTALVAVHQYRAPRIALWSRCLPRTAYRDHCGPVPRLP